MTETAWDLPDSRPLSAGTDFHLCADDLPGTPAGWSVTKRTLGNGVSAGVEVVEIDNGRMTFTVLTTRGMGIWAAERDGRRLGWKSPVRGPVHPCYVPLMEPSGIGWLEGFDELVVRCGLESNGSAVFDAQGRLLFPLHGKIANRPAHSLRVEIDRDRGRIVLHGVVDEIRFHFQKLQLRTAISTPFHGAQIAWHDEVVNLGGAPATMQMLYHVNLGEPLLAPGARLIAPVKAVCPHDRYPDERGTRDHQVYPQPTDVGSQQSFFYELLADPDGETKVLLQHPAGDQGATLSYNQRQLPWFTQWRNNVPSADGYVTALEPGTNFPNPRPFEEQHGRVVYLPPGRSWHADVALDWLTSRAEVQRAAADVAALQGTTAPDVQGCPAAAWSPK